jgi:hypothetical protein
MELTQMNLNSENDESFFSISIYYWLIFIFLFVASLGIRVFGITDQPFDFHPVKQFRSALTARAYLLSTYIGISARVEN